MIKIEQKTTSAKPGIVSLKVTETKTAKFTINTKGETEEMRKCPICGKEYQEPPAISRKDDKTEICPDCGVMEALEAAGFSDEAKAEALKEIHEARKGAGL